MGKIKCEQCEEVIRPLSSDDLVTCPRCLALVPTGNEDKIRKSMEAYRNHLPYPRAAVGRAIGYAAGIYDLSTHGTRIDTDAIEKKITKRFGASSAASETGLKMSEKRSVLGVQDERVGLMIYKVSGENAQRGKKKWSLIYVVFRGSRGDAIGSSNPLAAGWGQLAPGQAPRDRQNLDWRTNLNTGQDTPSWSPRVKIHKGFLEAYSSVRQKIHTEVARLRADSPEAQVITTGHSLGAGLALVCAHDLQCSTDWSPFAFAFCSPRSGNLAFAQDFNTQIGEQTGPLDSEPNGTQFHRAFVFVQSNDPISWGGEHGFKRDVSDASARKVLDRGNVVQKVVYAIGKKHKTRRVIYYHVRNLHRASFFGLHDYKPLVKALLD